MNHVHADVVEGEADMLVTGRRFIGRVLFVFLILLLLTEATTPAATIRVDWSPPSAPDLAGYKVRYGTNGVEFPQQIIIPDPGAVYRTIGGLTVGTTYYFVVQSYDTSANLSSPSNVATAEALPWSTSADPPIIPASVWLGQPVFDFSWDVSGFDGVAGTGLEVSLVNESFANPNGTEWDPKHRCFSWILTSPSGSSTMNAENFQGPGLYQIRVVALNGSGTIICCWSDSALLEVIAGPPPVDPETTTVTAVPDQVPADGISCSLITVTPMTAYGGPVGSGLSVTLETTAGILLDQVVDNGDGTYTQLLCSPMEMGQAVVSATVGEVSMNQRASVRFTDWEDLIITGPGPGVDNPPLVRVFDSAAVDMVHGLEFLAYDVDNYGVNVAAGDVTGDGRLEIITGAGPGDIYGPQVRGFDFEGAPADGVNFLAYGTNKYGVNVAVGDIDRDGYYEIVTGAGPGAVFGPHVRAWNYDDGKEVTPIAGVSFLAYGTNKYGVNVACGDIDGDGFDEIVSGAGPGEVFGPHVRGWNVDGGAYLAMPEVSFFAYDTYKYGVNVACGDIDGDGIDEIVTGPGPGEGFGFGPHVKIFDYDGGPAVTSIVSFLAYGTPSWGVHATCGDIDRDGIDEIVTAPGPGSEFCAHVRGFNYDDIWIQEIPGVDFLAYDEEYKFGARLAVGRNVID